MHWNASKGKMKSKECSECGSSDSSSNCSMWEDAGGSWMELFWDFCDTNEISTKKERPGWTNTVDISTCTSMGEPLRRYHELKQNTFCVSWDANVLNGSGTVDGLGVVWMLNNEGAVAVQGFVRQHTATSQSLYYPETCGMIRVGDILVSINGRPISYTGRSELSEILPQLGNIYSQPQQQPICCIFEYGQNDIYMNEDAYEANCVLDNLDDWLEDNKADESMSAVKGLLPSPAATAAASDHCANANTPLFSDLFTVLPAPILAPLMQLQPAVMSLAEVDMNGQVTCAIETATSMTSLAIHSLKKYTQEGVHAGHKMFLPGDAAVQEVWEQKQRMFEQLYDGSVPELPVEQLPQHGRKSRMQHHISLSNTARRTLSRYA